MILYYKKTPIYYDSKGQGSPIVLLHGFLESSTMWTNFIPEWKTKCQLITIDLPGHGQSGAIAEIHTMELMAEVVAAILTELKIDTAAFIGHSMGGYVGLAFAELFPNQISGLLLLNSTTYKDNDKRKDNRDRALKFMKTQKDMIISMSISNLFNEDARQKFASEIEALKKEALQFSTQGITAAIKGMRDRKDRTSVLKDFNKPKYIVCGKEDTIIPFSDSIAISENTNTPLKILKGGHMSWIENCEEIINLRCLIS